MDPKPFKPDTTDGIDSIELTESPSKMDSGEPQSTGASTASTVAPQSTKDSAASPASSPATGKNSAAKKRDKPGRAGDLGLAISALLLAVIFSVTNYLIGPVSETPRNVGYLSDVPKTGDLMTLLKLKLRLARGIFLPHTLNAANVDVANYYLWTANFKGAASYLTDAEGDGVRKAAVAYSELGMKLDQKQWKDAAKIADEWLRAIDSPSGPSQISELELIRLAYLNANRKDDAGRVEKLIDRARFLDDKMFSRRPPDGLWIFNSELNYTEAASKPQAKFLNFDQRIALVGACKSAENAMVAGQYEEARRYWQFVLGSPIAEENQITSYEREKSKVMLPVASLLAGDRAAAAKEFPAAFNSLDQYGAWFSDAQKSVVYKYYALLLRQQGAITESAKYEEIARKLLNEQPVKPWWDEKKPVDPWSEVSL